MKKHVILLADLDDEFASDLIDILRSAGMGVSSYEYSVGLEFHHELSLVESHDAVPIAIICQLSQQVHLTKVRDIVERARNHLNEGTLSATRYAVISDLISEIERLRSGRAAVEGGVTRPMVEFRQELREKREAEIRAAVIEECAKVAETAVSFDARAIASAIRALTGGPRE